MEPNRQSDVLERLEKDPALADEVRDLVLASVLGKVEEFLGGKSLWKPGAAMVETTDARYETISSGNKDATSAMR